MANNKQPTHKGSSAGATVMAGAVGAAVGAATVFLMDSQNRRRMMEVIETAVKRAREGADDAKRIASDAVADLETQVDRARNSLPTVMQRAKDEAKQKARDVKTAARRDK